jgi:hypothetical protein
VGILDYGNGYAAKTGSSWVQSAYSRRLVFSFTGWLEPTAPRGCGRALVIPRELRLNGDELMTEPIPETAVLRVASSHRSARVAAGDAAKLDRRGVAIATGSQVEVRLLCSLPALLPTRGRTGLRTLSTMDGSQFSEIGCAPRPAAQLQPRPVT